MEPLGEPGPDSSQDVNPLYLQQLRELDIPEEAAKQVGQQWWRVFIFLFRSGMIRNPDILSKLRNYLENGGK